MQVTWRWRSRHEAESIFYNLLLYPVKDFELGLARQLTFSFNPTTTFCIHPNSTNRTRDEFISFPSRAVGNAALGARRPGGTPGWIPRSILILQGWGKNAWSTVRYRKKFQIDQPLSPAGSFSIEPNQRLVEARVPRICHYVWGPEVHTLYVTWNRLVCLRTIEWVLIWGNRPCLSLHARLWIM